MQASEIEKEKNNEYRLNLNTITLVNGRSFTLKVYNLEADAKVSFKSANPDIASVNENGTFTANKVGKTTITATVRRGLTTTPLTCEVTIGPPAFSIKMTKPIIVLGLDQNYLLEVVMKPTNTAELAKFSSFDSSIASISSGGRLTGNSLGMTFVFAEINATNPDESRKFASCNVIVIDPEEVSQLNEYFSDHFELSLVPEAQLSSALYEFFNKIYYAQDTESSAKTDTTTDQTRATTSPSSNTTNNIQAADTTAASNSEATSSNEELSLVESLHKFLDSKFNLDGLRQAYQERLQPVVNLQVISLSGDSSRR
ncbi:MAG: Ig-like domain-containing protein [Clostridiales bacterium]|nr:Ig-like domain-containing protein [Clostridiales bacterium]